MRWLLFVLIVTLAACGGSGHKKEEPTPPPPPVMCEWDATILASSPLCVEPPAQCEWDDTITEDDPLCVEPPPPCEWNPDISSEDPACVQPPCEIVLRWTNPTEDVDGVPLDPDELVAATFYMFRIPWAEERGVDAVWGGVPPYILMFTHVSNDHGVEFWYHLTVSNLDADGNPQESDASNETSRVCE